MIRTPWPMTALAPAREGDVLEGVHLRCHAMDDGWTIDIDAAGDPADVDEHFDDRIGELERALEPWSGAVVASDARDHFGARFSYDTDAINPVQVLEEGLDIFHDAAIEAGLPVWQVVRCEILTYTEDDARSDGDDDE